MLEGRGRVSKGSGSPELLPAPWLLAAPMKSKRNRRPPRFRSGRTAPKFPGPNQAWRPPRRCALAALSGGPRRARPRSPRARAGENPGLAQPHPLQIPVSLSVILCLPAVSPSRLAPSLASLSPGRSRQLLPTPSGSLKPPEQAQVGTHRYSCNSLLFK